MWEEGFNRHLLLPPIFVNGNFSQTFPLHWNTPFAKIIKKIISLFTIIIYTINTSQKYTNTTCSRELFVQSFDLLPKELCNLSSRHRSRIHFYQVKQKKSLRVKMVIQKISHVLAFWWIFRQLNVNNLFQQRKAHLKEFTNHPMLQTRNDKKKRCMNGRDERDK